MSKSSPTRGSKKNIHKPNTALMVAVITLIGVIITAMLSSPVIVALVQKTPISSCTPSSTLTISLPLPTNPPVTVSVPNPGDIYLLPTLPSSSKDRGNTATTTPSLTGSQPELIEIVFSNPGTRIIHFVIETDKGILLLRIDVPPGTSQIVYIPSGNYHYWFTEEGVKYRNPPSGIFKVEGKQEFCFSSSSLAVCSSSAKPRSTPPP